MYAHDALKLTINGGQFVSMAYLSDLSDADLMRRAAPGINHINWQVGHLILSDHDHISAILPGSMPPLPEGFARAYTRETAGFDDPAAFFHKSVLLETFQQQRAALLAALDSVSAEGLEQPSPDRFKSFAPMWANLFELAGSHWLMHCGQWAVVRRQLGKPPLF